MLRCGCNENISGERKVFKVKEATKKIKGVSTVVPEISASFSEIAMRSQNLTQVFKKFGERFISLMANNPNEFDCLLYVDVFANYHAKHHKRLKAPCVESVKEMIQC